MLASLSVRGVLDPGDLIFRPPLSPYHVTHPSPDTVEAEPIAPLFIPSHRACLN